MAMTNRYTTAPPAIVTQVARIHSRIAAPSEAGPASEENNAVETPQTLPPSVDMPREVDLLSQAWVSAISEPQTGEDPVSLAAVPLESAAARIHARNAALSAVARIYAGIAALSAVFEVVTARIIHAGIAAPSAAARIHARNAALSAVASIYAGIAALSAVFIVTAAALAVNLSTPMRPPLPTSPPLSQPTQERSFHTGETELSTPSKPAAMSTPITPEIKRSEATPKSVPQEQMISSSTSGTAVPGTPVTAHLDFAGTWGVKGCRVPYYISANRAQGYGGRKCEFIQTTQETVNTWRVPADCSRGVERWKANIKLTLNGNRLTWSSERGTVTYVRCSRRA
jgi:hypothetical protein